ncbi:MAG: COQ9 family protein [Paracoccaceae bacterium]
MSNEIRDKLLDAALAHVAFDGWSEATLLAAAEDVGVSADAAKAAFPRGALGLATAFHLRGDDLMVARMGSEDLKAMRYSERVAAAVRFRLEVVEDKDLVRRGMTLFALPQNAPEAARLIWGTADRIWQTLGDTSDDINWYSKRAILSGVYSSCVLFWLGDESAGHAASWEFVDRRIGDVMQFEKFKARIRNNEKLAPLLRIPDALFGGIKAPAGSARPNSSDGGPGTPQNKP